MILRVPFICKATLSVTLLAGFASAQIREELGRMWTFENPPLAYLEKEYGFKPDQAWLNRLRLASIRLGTKESHWCSASFVSPKGLIMTNHHCVRGNIDVAGQQKRKDLVKTGFYARSLEDEIRLYDRRGGELKPVAVQQLVSMEDVTAKVNAGVTADDSAAAIDKKRKANIEKIEAKCKEDDASLHPQVVELHQGALFQLYLYKTWNDVRLVCAPHLQSAHFGGDPDNFTYPRYCIDFSFCRAYEDGKPADTSKYYFKWSKSGPKENDLVFVSGNPGSTGRLLTKAQMDFLRDAEYPMQLEQINDQVRVVKEVGRQNPAYLARMKTTLLGIQNSQKAVTGYLSGLLDKKLMAEKAQYEAEFKAKVHADAKLSSKFGKVWQRLDEICKEKTKLAPIIVLCSPAYSATLGRAVAIVDAVDPERTEAEREAAMKAAKQPVNPMRLRHPVLAGLMASHLENIKRWLPEDNPYRKVLVGESTGREALAKMNRSKVMDDDYVKELLEVGQKAVEASTDHLIMAARAFQPMVHKAKKRMEALEAEESAQSTLIGQALFAVYGDKISPDATMTLRFSDGVVKGYNFNGTLAPWRTTFYGLYARNAEFGDKDPFHLPKTWLKNKDKVNLKTPVDFVTTNDIIGGNSGSPVVNKDLEVVGLIFDGNIEQLPNRFLFKENNERSVSVHVHGIVESCRKIYGATRVLQELGYGEGKTSEKATSKPARRRQRQLIR